MQLSTSQINYCMECGVCTGSCPVSSELESFSPRQIIKRTLVDGDENFLTSKDVWACLSCARCSDRCPVGINFHEFLRTYRQKAREVNNLPHESHHGVLQTLNLIQTRGLKQNKTDWAREAGRFKEQGDVYYFVGCLPFHNVVFRYLDLEVLDTARNSLALLNGLDIEPVISNDERCCGHDAFWSGNIEVFKELAAHNIEVIKASGAKTVLFTCPEGYHTFKEYYPQYFGELPFEVLHMSEYLAGELSGKDFPGQRTNGRRVTYHDPCRLGRFSGIYEQPRELIKMVPETELIEMQRNRENALCCGTSCWMECAMCSRGMQVERLEEALDSGAETLITACPKCRIHLSCGLKTTDLQLEITDIYTYLRQALQESEE